MTKKRYWLIPVLFVFIIFGVLILLSEGTSVAPFIYSIF